MIVGASGGIGSVATTKLLTMSEAMEAMKKANADAGACKGPSG